ncbi:MAG: hypothetical protein COA90_01955 [Gammaproteobacteria bacterium]|nr:MAG: hypothetical protein COA90_01955 [Gammaproteobacteria bacterium]
MKIKWNRVNRKIHYWGAVICALPILVVLISGVLLLLKKEFEWVQPPTIKTQSRTSELQFEQILAVAKTVEEAGISSWQDIKRLDVRPNKGVIKIQANNQWEIQLDYASGEILHVAYRRSDFIESLHDGSFFHDFAKLGLFLPAAIILLFLWITGMYLFLLPYLAKNKVAKSKSKL